MQYKKFYTYLLKESDASDAAHKAGLVSDGWGKWKDKSGNIVATTKGDKLVYTKGKADPAVKAASNLNPTQLAAAGKETKKLNAPVKTSKAPPVNKAALGPADYKNAPDVVKKQTSATDPSSDQKKNPGFLKNIGNKIKTGAEDFERWSWGDNPDSKLAKFDDWAAGEADFKDIFKGKNPKDSPVENPKGLSGHTLDFATKHLKNDLESWKKKNPNGTASDYLKARPEAKFFLKALAKGSPDKIKDLDNWINS